MEISKAKIKVFSSLSSKKHRKEENLFIVEGSKCVLDTIDYFSPYAIVATKQWVETHRDKINEEVLMTATPTQISQISSLSTASDVVAIYQLPKWELDSNQIADNLTLVLDGVQDPGNLGTIIRIADWFGIHQIVASHDTVDVFNPKTIQATMGAISRVRVIYTDLESLLKSHNDLPIYGTLLEGENIYEKSLKSPAFIIMGNEGKGISPAIRELISEGLFIPSYPGDIETSESLNVGVATAITIAEFRRQAIIK